MKISSRPNVKRQYFSDKKENPDLVNNLDHDDFYTESPDEIIYPGFDPIFTFLVQMDESKSEDDETAARAIGILHALTTNVMRRIEQFFTDLDRHMGDPSIIRRRHGNWEHPENEAIGVELIQRTPKAGKSIADLIPLVDAALARGHDIDKVLRELLDKDPVEKREVLS